MRKRLWQSARCSSVLAPGVRCTTGWDERPRLAVIMWLWLKPGCVLSRRVSSRPGSGYLFTLPSSTCLRTHRPALRMMWTAGHCTFQNMTAQQAPC